MSVELTQELSTEQQAAAWRAVCAVLDKHRPYWMAGTDPAADKAVEAIEGVFATLNEVDEVAFALTGNEGSEDDGVTALQKFARFVENHWPGKYALEVIQTAPEVASDQPLFVTTLATATGRN